jgi:hypothetical protein
VLDLFHLNLLDLCREQIHLFSTTVAMRADKVGGRGFLDLIFIWDRVRVGGEGCASGCISGGVSGLWLVVVMLGDGGFCGGARTSSPATRTGGVALIPNVTVLYSVRDTPESFGQSCDAGVRQRLG